MIPHREENLCIVGFFGVNVKANGNKIEKTRHISLLVKEFTRDRSLCKWVFYIQQFHQMQSQSWDLDYGDPENEKHCKNTDEVCVIPIYLLINSFSSFLYLYCYSWGKNSITYFDFFLSCILFLWCYLLGIINFHSSKQVVTSILLHWIFLRSVSDYVFKSSLINLTMGKKVKYFPASVR